MSPADQKKLNDAHSRFLAYALCLAKPESGNELAVEDVMGYGTAKSEKILSISGMVELAEQQWAQSAELQLRVELHPVFRKVLGNETTAFFVDEVDFHMVVDGEAKQIELRLTVLYALVEDQWKCVHWHGSRPAENEGDVWHQGEWRRKKEELQAEVDQKTNELKQSLESLRAAQAQLIQSEKMASLGELTAGIAHEIQNPLNFVNNFSEVNTELIDELRKELAIDNKQSAMQLAEDIKENEAKIAHHGKRADAIVKGMLQHSRKSTGQKELTDINELCEEYLRLAYHGLRAKDKSFNAKFETHLDPALPKINVVPQDIGRVVLNLINNAFYAVSERLKTEGQKQDSTYEPTVTVSTKNLGNKIEIRVKDNGPGIPDSIKAKIFQPFFTTKPTGLGTGLGLSLSYDIITKGHGGQLHAESKEGEGSDFTITLPIS